MKNLVILLSIGLLAAGCGKAVQFSKAGETNFNRPDPNPDDNVTPPPVCVVNPALQVETPAIVQSGQDFFIRVNRPTAQWSLTKDGVTTNYNSATVQLNLSEAGNYEGNVSTRNNCDLDESTRFSIQVVDGVTGHGLVINNNDVYTISDDVVLSLVANNATEMYVTNTANCVSGGSWVPFSASLNWRLAETNRATRVYAKFRNSVVETSCVYDEISHDNMAPTVRFTQTPPNPSNSTSASFTIDAQDSVSGVRALYCTVNNAAIQPCNNNPSFSNLPEGANTISVIAEDNAGNRSAPITFDWLIDVTGPSVQITRAPSSPTIETSADFEFNVMDSGSGIASVTCRVDGMAPATCQSPRRYTGLSNGSHTFTVTVVDRAGLTASAQHTWIVDDRVENQTIVISNGGGRSDVIFVINNSESMYTELRESISYRFSRFIEYLGNSDYQIAVTSADATGIREFEAGRFTRILRTATPGPGIALVPAQYMVHPQMGQYTQRNFMATILRPEAICTQVGTHMCPNAASAYQEGIRSTLLALQRPENQGFIRQNSALHVVVISDDDEGGRNLTDNNGNILPSTPEHNRPETLVNFVNAQYPGKEFKFHAVARGQNVNTCNNVSGVSATKAPIYQRATQITGGVMANICNDLNRTEVQAIANSIRNNSGSQSYQLNCDPRDVNGDGIPDVMATYNPNPSQPVQVVVSGRSVSFTPQLPAGTQVQLQYRCL